MGRPVAGPVEDAIAGKLLGLLFPDEIMSHLWRRQIECADPIDRMASDLYEVTHNEGEMETHLFLAELYPGV